MIKHIIFIFSLCLIFIIACKHKSEQEIKTKVSEELIVNDFDIWKTLNYSERQGKHIFDKYCVICHGKRGEGDGFNSYNLNPRPQNLQDSIYIKKVSDVFLYQIISSGGSVVNKSSQMPYYKYLLDETEIKNIISYIRKLKITP